MILPGLNCLLPVDSKAFLPSGAAARSVIVEEPVFRQHIINFFLEHLFWMAASEDEVCPTLKPSAWQLVHPPPVTLVSGTLVCGPYGTESINMKVMKVHFILLPTSKLCPCASPFYWRITTSSPFPIFMLSLYLSN